MSEPIKIDFGGVKGLIPGQKYHMTVPVLRGLSGEPTGETAVMNFTYEGLEQINAYLSEAFSKAITPEQKKAIEDAKGDRVAVQNIVLEVLNNMGTQ